MSVAGTQYSVLSTRFLRSAGFLVRGVGPAEAAVLLELDPLAGVRLVLLRHIVATFAGLTRQVDRRSLVTHSVARFAPWSTEYGVPSIETVISVLGTRVSVLLVSLYSCLYLVILVTRPAPTVRPPSRIANRNPSSIAIGFNNSTDISVLSPGITISVPAGNFTVPVTSVVRK